MKGTRTGFTLIELLFVVGIIAILMAILLPALSQARSVAREMVCLSNLKQIGLGLQSYTQNFNEWTLPNTLEGMYGGAVDEVNFMVYLYNHEVNSEDVFECPAARGNPSPASQYNSAAARGLKILNKGSYIQNSVYKWNTQARNLYNANMGTSVTVAFMDSNFRGWTGATNAKTPIKTSRVRNFSGAIYATDAFSKPDAMSVNAWKSDVGSLNHWLETDWGPLYETTGTGTESRDVGYHHLRLGFNALFGDMHAEKKLKSRVEEWHASNQ